MEKFDYFKFKWINALKANEKKWFDKNILKVYALVLKFITHTHCYFWSKVYINLARVDFS